MEGTCLALSMQRSYGTVAGLKRLGEFMVSLANEAHICIAVIALRGRDIRGGFAGSGSVAEAEESIAGTPALLQRLGLLELS